MPVARHRHKFLRARPDLVEEIKRNFAKRQDVQKESETTSLLFTECHGLWTRLVNSLYQLTVHRRAVENWSIQYMWLWWRWAKTDVPSTSETLQSSRSVLISSSLIDRPMHSDCTLTHGP